MIGLISINKNLRVPIYQQLVNGIINAIEDGKISEGDQLSSINQIATSEQLSRETVIKAFKILQQKGLITAVHGKGFFVTSNQVNIQHRVFILLDTFSAYKEIMYNSIKNTFGKNAYLDVYFHHFNIKVFQKLIEEAAGNYSSYIILPFDHYRITEYIDLLPVEHVYIIDRKPRFLSKKFYGVYQDFSNDVYFTLTQLKERLSKYWQFSLVFRNLITQVPIELKEGFEKFCLEHNIKHQVLESLDGYKPTKGEAFLVIDDEDLVFLVEQSMALNQIVGLDIGILSYNETSLKKVVAGGISVISTDFSLMGKSVVNMIVASKPELLTNPCNVINRESF